MIAPSYANYLTQDIGNSHFRFTVDESTNEANISCLDITVRNYSEKKKSLVDTFYRLGPLEDCTANTFHETIRKCMDEDGLKNKNLIGIGCDGANAIVGPHHSLATLLKNDSPNITVFRCICHSLHLTASKATQMLPIGLTFIGRESYNWFSSSPKRIKKYRDLYQPLQSITPQKIPGMAATCWLTRLEAKNVIVEQ